MPSFKQLSPLP